jgi:hypothetical protein
MNFSYKFRKAMIKPENDGNAEDVMWPTFPSAATEVSIVNKIGRIICQYEGVDGRKI